MLKELQNTSVLNQSHSKSQSRLSTLACCFQGCSSCFAKCPDRMKGWVCRLLSLRAEVREKSAITTPEHFPLHLPSCCWEACWVKRGCTRQLLPAVRAEQGTEIRGRMGTSSHLCIPPTSQQQAQPAVRGVSESPNHKAHSLIAKTELIRAWAILAFLYILLLSWASCRHLI